LRSAHARGKEKKRKIDFVKRGTSCPQGAAEKKKRGRGSALSDSRNGRKRRRKRKRAGVNWPGERRKADIGIILPVPVSTPCEGGRKRKRLQSSRNSKHRQKKGKTIPRGRSRNLTKKRIFFLNRDRGELVCRKVACPRRKKREGRRRRYLPC